MVRAHDASRPSNDSHILRGVLKRARYATTDLKAVAGANHLREITLIDRIRSATISPEDSPSLSRKRAEPAALASSENEGGSIQPAEGQNMLSTVRWMPPVKIGNASIIGPLEAHRFMMNHWPHVKGAKFALAHMAILAALDGRQTPQEARASFDRAVKEACLN
ncbi:MULTISPECIES: DUF982 domain-containing protein [Rhizobium]|uniref:DUF982 domain-containing protein n=1 Tax=Rhizobium terrae TaxID=2171756 RepID=UPI00196721F1|nr:DUF982 domain-containing protein [Rhizobium terrae]